MYKWLFCFQKSVALVLTHLMQESSKKMSSQSQYPQNQLPQMPSKYKDDKNNMATTKFNSNSINSSDTVVDGNDNNNSNYYNDNDNSNQTSIWYNENGNYTNRIKNKNTNFRTVSVDSSKHSNYHHHGKSLYSEEPLNDTEKYNNRMQANNHHQSSNNNSRSSGSSNNMAVGSMPSLSNLESYLSSQATNNRFNSYNTNLFNSNTSSTTTATASSHTQYLPTSSSAMIPIIRSREVSVEKVATSYKEDNIGFRLESLLQSLSDSRSQSCHSSYNDDDDDDDNYPFIHDVHDIDDDNNNNNNEDYRRNNQQLHEIEVDADDDE